MALKSTVAGSFPKPSWLAEPEKLWAPWHLEARIILARFLPDNGHLFRKIGFCDFNV